MATVAEANAFIKSTYQHEVLNENFYKLILTDTDSDRSQLVFVEVDEYKVIITSPFATTSQINADKALDAAADQVFGVKRFNTWYCLQNSVWIENLDANEITETVSSVAGAADTIEKTLGFGDAL